ncbi:MAG: phosphoenolpyruvate--protein phosphotransferase [Gammaproteobacteria bacterium]
MLATLRRIVQEVNAARDLQHALSIIVLRVKQAMRGDVCSVYLFDPSTHAFILMASDGLNPRAVGQVRLNFGEGLVSLVAETKEPINLADAMVHPRFRFFEGTDEENFHGFMGVPIIHHRKVMGVLIVQQQNKRRFEEDEVAFLLTIASQLSGAIAHAEVSGGIEGITQATTATFRPIQGVSGAPGVAIGRAVVVYPAADLNVIPDRKMKDIDGEIKIFLNAIGAVRRDIETLKLRLNNALGDEERALFDAYLLMLGSKSLVDKTVDRIRGGNWAQGALRETVTEYSKTFQDMDDHYLRERSADIRDLGVRILVHLQQDNAVSYTYPEKTVLIGEEITATMLAEVPVGCLVGVVSVRGSVTSHVSILAHALDIPAVVGVHDLPVSRVDGCEFVVDGYSGLIHVSPSAIIREEYSQLAQEEHKLSVELAELKNLPATTLDGAHIPLYINTGLQSDMVPSLDCGADGVGLYRTEFPFMIRERFPSEEEQKDLYRQVLAQFSPLPVILRTLDVGGDKALPYFPINEDNPFLGWRGIRITLDHPEIFRIQLRALLRASVGFENMQILLPMVGNVSEVDETLQLLKQVYAELTEEGEVISFPKVGVMIEVPASVYQLDKLAQRVDFLSIGTNDLTQYLLAVDRNNARVARLFDALHPSVLRVVKLVVEEAKQYNKPVCVCGEMAGDPAAALILLGIGVDSMSMSATSMPKIKWMIRNMSSIDARNIVEKALTFDSAADIREYLDQELLRSGLGGLVRAGY